MVATSLVEDSFLGEKKEGKHLIFQLEERGYGIPILTVNEIIGITNITPIPKAQGFIKGVINLRGKIMPVMDLRLKFGMSEKVYDEQTCIIIVNVDFDNVAKQIGVIVDIVSEVVDIPASEIEAPPEYGDSDGAGFLSGIGKVKDKVVMLLDIEKVICAREIKGFLSEEKVSINTVEKGV